MLKWPRGLSFYSGHFWEEEGVLDEAHTKIQRKDETVSDQPEYMFTLSVWT